MADIRLPPATGQNQVLGSPSIVVHGELARVASQAELDATPRSTIAVVVNTFGSFVRGDLLEYSTDAWRVLPASIGDNTVGTDQLIADSVTEGELSAGLRDAIERFINFPNLRSVIRVGNALQFTRIDADGNESSQSVSLPSGGGNGDSGLTIPQIVTALEDLSGENRLDYGALKNAPAAPPDYNDVTNLLTYSRTASYDLAQGPTVGQTYDTDVDLSGGDDAIVVGLQGVTGTATVNVAAIRALPSIAIGTDVVLTAAVDSVDFTIDSRQYYLARNENNLLVASGEINDMQVVNFRINGYRVESYADRNSNTLVPKTRLPSDVVYSGHLAPQAVIGDAARWPRDKLPTDTLYDNSVHAQALAGNVDRWSKAKVPADAVYTATQRYTPANKTKLDAIPNQGADNASKIIGFDASGNYEAQDAPTGGGGGLNQGQVDARIGPAFRAGQLTNAARGHVQDVLDAFDGGGWTDVTGAAANTPYVANALSAAQFTATTIVAATYVEEGQTGPRLTDNYIAIRIPDDYEGGLTRLRLRVGADTYLINDPDEQYFPLRDNQQLTHVTTAGGFDYYSLRVANIQAGAYWHVQLNTPFELSPRVELPQPAHATLLQDDVGIGVTVTNSGQTFRSSPTANAFDNPIDIDDNPHGHFVVVADISLTGRGSNTIGFDEDTTNPQLTARISSQVPATELAATTAYDRSQQNGVEVGDQDIRNGSATLGRFSLLLVHDSTGQVRYDVIVHAGAGALNYTVAIGRLYVYFVPSDAPAATTGGGGLALFDKTIHLAAAAGGDPDADPQTTGHHTNRKLQATSTGAVALNDWGALTLVADNTAVGGMTATTSEVVFAESGHIWIELSVEFNANTGGGASRLYCDLRGALHRSGSTTHPVSLRSPTFYTKTAVDDDNLAQGPGQMHGECQFMFVVEAGDRISFDWRAYIQTSTAVDIEASLSELDVRIMK